MAKKEAMKLFKMSVSLLYLLPRRTGEQTQKKNSSNNIDKYSGEIKNILKDNEEKIGGESQAQSQNKSKKQKAEGKDIFQISGREIFNFINRLGNISYCLKKNNEKEDRFIHVNLPQKRRYLPGASPGRGVDSYTMLI